MSSKFKSKLLILCAALSKSINWSQLYLDPSLYTIITYSDTLVYHQLNYITTKCASITVLRLY